MGKYVPTGYYVFRVVFGDRTEVMWDDMSEEDAEGYQKMILEPTGTFMVEDNDGGLTTINPDRVAFSKVYPEKVWES